MSQLSAIKVTVTIDGVKKQIGSGLTSLKELVAEAGVNSKITSFTVTSAAPAQAATINGNDSYIFSGGEVLTTKTTGV